MAGFDTNLDITITEAQGLAIKADLDASKATLAGIANIILNEGDGDHLNGIDDKRLPYVQRAVQEFGPAYPDLVGKRITTVRADRLFDALIQLRNLDPQLDEYKDRVKDLSNNIEELLYQYMLEMYKLSKQYDGVLAGAQIVRTYLGELFEGQGAISAPAGGTP